MVFFANIGLTIWDILGLVAMLAALVVVGVIVATIIRFFRLWVQSVTTGAGIGFLDMLGMTFRRVPPELIVRSKIIAVQSGLAEAATGMTTRSLEAHYLAGGNVPNVVRAMIAARKAKIVDLPFKLAMAIDLAGRNVLEAVQTSVYPKVIDCPPQGSVRETLDAVAKNGIQLHVKARVTVRTNIQQLIGGATEETIVARVGEGIVSAIGSSATHSDVLENPDRISKAVLDRKLDRQTAYEIVSIDIADIIVGKNIGARLQTSQAEADVRVAQAAAEGRRVMAVAQQCENVASIEEARAQLIQAEAEVPNAIADGFRRGHLTIMNFYLLQNMQADTDMRSALATTYDLTARVAEENRELGQRSLPPMSSEIDKSPRDMNRPP